MLLFDAPPPPAAAVTIAVPASASLTLVLLQLLTPTLLLLPPPPPNTTASCPAPSPLAVPVPCCVVPSPDPFGSAGDDEALVGRGCFCCCCCCASPSLPPPTLHSPSSTHVTVVSTPDAVAAAEPPPPPPRSPTPAPVGTEDDTVGVRAAGPMRVAATLLRVSAMTVSPCRVSLFLSWVRSKERNEPSLPRPWPPAELGFVLLDEEASSWPSLPFRAATAAGSTLCSRDAPVVVKTDRRSLILDGAVAAVALRLTYSK